ncbi:MAG: MBL fold metallo-hydrolase, partial [Thermoguttaceae bacterium]|nr:MBL fold metallo-hydrolase [Thermoguttaceae bacterium]
FLALGLAAPLAFKSGLVSPKWAFSAEDNAIEVSFAADPNAPKVTMWQTPRQTGSQMMGYIFRTATGETVVFDGGMPGDGKYLAELLKKRCGGKVDAWYLTHAHGDHFGALGEILAKTPDALEIGKLYFNFPNRDWLDKYEAGCRKCRHPFFAALEKNFKGEIVTPKPGDVQTFGDALSIETLNDFDESLTTNAINNSTIIFRLDVAGKSLLMLGDLGAEGGDRVLKNVPKEKSTPISCRWRITGNRALRRSFTPSRRRPFAFGRRRTGFGTTTPEARAKTPALGRRSKRALGWTNLESTSITSRRTALLK